MVEPIVIRPLAEDYEVLKVSVTDLEKFKSCPRRFKELDKFDQNSDAYVFGNKAHEMLQAVMFNRNNYDLLYEYFVEPEQDKLHKKWL